MFTVGDRVKRSDVTEKSIPAFRDMRGTVIEVSPNGKSALIRWDGDKASDFAFRDSSTIMLA